MKNHLHLSAPFRGSRLARHHRKASPGAACRGREQVGGCSSRRNGLPAQRGSFPAAGVRRFCYHGLAIPPCLCSPDGSSCGRAAAAPEVFLRAGSSRGQAGAGSAVAADRRKDDSTHDRERAVPSGLYPAAALPCRSSFYPAAVAQPAGPSRGRVAVARSCRAGSGRQPAGSSRPVLPAPAVRQQDC